MLFDQMERYRCHDGLVEKSQLIVNESPPLYLTEAPSISLTNRNSTTVSHTVRSRETRGVMVNNDIGLLRLIRILLMF